MNVGRRRNRNAAEQRFLAAALVGDFPCDSAVKFVVDLLLSAAALAIGVIGFGVVVAQVGEAALDFVMIGIAGTDYDGGIGGGVGFTSLIEAGIKRRGCHEGTDEPLVEFVKLAGRVGSEHRSLTCLGAKPGDFVGGAAVLEGLVKPLGFQVIQVGKLRVGGTFFADDRAIGGLGCEFKLEGNIGAVKSGVA